MRPGESAELTPLAGGVSSDLWRVTLPNRTLCVKGALAQLKVSQEWHAPISRNRVEYEWLRFAATVAPTQVPQVFAHDDRAGLFAMQFLSPEEYPVWKSQLLAGQIHPEEAYNVGDLVGRLHAASAKDPSIRSPFATDDNFDALRIEPYFRVTARANPDLADRIEEVAAATASTHLAVVHGDVSPKNILIGSLGPVLLDAECGWFGDPAFDVAFCLSHLLLKAIVLPEHVAHLNHSARQFLAGYNPHIDWESADNLMGRAATLLPLLALARVDGASPVEYLTQTQRGQVRALARGLVSQPAPDIDSVIETWTMAAAGSQAGLTPFKEKTP